MSTRNDPEYLALRREKYKQERHKILPKLREVRLANPKKFMLKDAARRAKNKGLEFTITEEDLIFPEFCPVFGIKLIRNEKCLRLDSPSLDRIDNSKGYIPGNVAIISNKANMLKKDATIKDLEKLLIYMKNE